MKLSITQKCVSEFLRVCVWAKGDILGGEACVLLARELLAAASDSVSSSAFIRSASRRCHLSFPWAYITHARKHTLARTHTQPGNHWLTSVTKTFWLVSWSLFRRGKGRTGWLSISNQGVNMHNGGLIRVLTQSVDYIFIDCVEMIFFIFFKLLWEFGCRCHSLWPCFWNCLT